MLTHDQDELLDEEKLSQIKKEEQAHVHKVEPKDKHEHILKETTVQEQQELE